MSTLLRPGPKAPQTSAVVARRLGSGRWRDPRLAVGIVLVAGSVVVGSQILAAADDTTQVWALRSDVMAGSVVSADTVEVDDVQLDDGGDASLYWAGDAPFPGGLVAAHDLVAGELISHSDVRPPDGFGGAELPVPVQDGNRPTDLQVGDVVDVWVAPGPDGESAQSARLALSAVEVVAVDPAGGGIGGGSATVVLLGLDQSADESMPQTLSAVTSGTVVLVRVGR